MADTATTLNPHAYHRNLPPHHIDQEDGIPFITKFAQQKASQIIKLVQSIELKEELFVSSKDNQDEMDMDGEEEDEEEEILENDHEISSDYTLASVIKKCSRLHSQLSTLEGLKHSGITQLELCEMVLRVLKLLTATVSIETNGGGSSKATLFFENVGYIWKSSENEEATSVQKLSAAEFEDRYTSSTRRFALPSPARESLLSILSSILSKKSLLRAVSNAAIYPDTETGDSERILLIIHWRPLLGMLWRTAPYLDESKAGAPPKDSNSRLSTVLRRTVHMIRHARHFFDQGIRPDANADLRQDATAQDIWDMVEEDVMIRTHSYACYRGLILMYLFQPTRCSSQYYLDRLSRWFEGWTNIDRCHEMDFIWLVLFCRARKYVNDETFDWGPIRRRLLTHGQYWLQIPIGGAAMDQRSFPRAATPRSRSCPSRLKAFVGSSGSYEEGIDFIAKVTKLLATNIGMNKSRTSSSESISQGTSDVLRLLSFVTPYFNPSNVGSWTFTLGAFLHYFCYEVCSRVGVTASMMVMKKSNPVMHDAMVKVEPYLATVAIPPKELVLLFDALLPLCQQALYSKNGHVGRAGEAAMVYLTQIEHRIAAPFLDFATQALGVSAVNLAHQAPSALSAITRLVQPSLRQNPEILLERLPHILQLSLAGIDSNDQNKSIRTLIFYRNLLSWVPIGFDRKTSDDRTSNMDDEEPDGTLRVSNDMADCLSAVTNSSEYLDSLSKLPKTSLLYQNPESNDSADLEVLLEGASSAMEDWVLGFLDRIYELLRASGEREKSSKTASGVANRHSNSDVQQARNFSRVMKECLLQTFASMDERAHSQAIRSVAQFIADESLPAAAKDAASLCQAVAAIREMTVDGEKTTGSPGLDILVPILCDDVEHQSNKTLIYRLRCLAGAVRTAGGAVSNHQADVKRALAVAMSSDDKHVFKTGCKLLRHLLSSQCESYAILSSSTPSRDIGTDNAKAHLGKSSQLGGHAVIWHVPTEKELGFACELLKENTMSHIEESANASQGLDQWTGLRRCLRVVRYSLRGGAGVLIDYDGREETADKKGSRLDVTMVPHERAVGALLHKMSDATRESLEPMRKRICTFAVMLSSLIASETADEEREASAHGEDNFQLSKDIKVCKEVSEISLLLLTRRGANFRCQEGKTIWKAQKQLFGSDYALSAGSDHLSMSLERAALIGGKGHVEYKDGEAGGKTMPRRLLVARMQLFQETIQRNGSFEIPRRLRRLQLRLKAPSTKMFHADTKQEDAFKQFLVEFESPSFRALDGYEGLIDGLFALSCHPNTQVRAAGIGVIDYSLTRFGWLVKSRIPRLLSAIALNDGQSKSSYGIPSCKYLSEQVDSQGKHKRLAEVLRGVCSILTNQRSIKEVMGSEKTRADFVRTLCETNNALLLMPTEDMQKMVHYFHSIFSPFRSKFYSVPRVSSKDKRNHDELISYLLEILKGEDATTEQSENGDSAPNSEKATHWRKKLLVTWFVTNSFDLEDYVLNEKEFCKSLWELAIYLLEKEVGQPLQRMALGLFGRLVSFSNGINNDALTSRLRDKKFCELFSVALVFDHREDTSVGGGHDAQWSAGVEDLLRDATRNVAPRSMFPFVRTGQSSSLMKLTHSQLLESVLVMDGRETATVASQMLLDLCSKKLATAPPSEDQRNQQVTSAEIFSGITRALLSVSSAEECESIWSSMLIPYLDEIMPKIPVSLTGAYFDAVRYGIQGAESTKYFPLVNFVIDRIDSSIWKAGDTDSMAIDATGTDGFTLQSKWLYICSALLVELDAPSNARPFFHSTILVSDSESQNYLQASLESSVGWERVRTKLLPRLLDSIGHPYESCRDHLAGNLYRIYNYYSRMTAGAKDTSQGNNPVTEIMKVFTSAPNAPDTAQREKYHALITIRKFLAYCLYLGDAKRDFEDIILPLMPIVFDAVRTNVAEPESGTSTNASQTEEIAMRALEADVAKGFRQSVAEISVSCVLSFQKEGTIGTVLDVTEAASQSDVWQVRQAVAHFIRYFQGGHKFLLSDEETEKTTSLVAGLLADERREVSSAAMSALTGIVAATSPEVVTRLVDKYALMAKRSKIKKKKKKNAVVTTDSKSPGEEKSDIEKEMKRSRNQKKSVFFLCAVVMANPYETPLYVPIALAAISKHSFEKSAPLGVRDTVKKCCASYKKTHMSDNWEVHRQVFTQEQLEALEDVVSSPHYYA